MTAHEVLLILLDELSQEGVMVERASLQWKAYKRAADRIAKAALQDERNSKS
jgi:hypothetical protein